MVTRQGAFWINILGSQALLYTAFGITEKTRGAKDDLNTAEAGTMMGTQDQHQLLCTTQWESMKGSLSQSHSDDFANLWIEYTLIIIQVNLYKSVWSYSLLYL